MKTAWVIAIGVLGLLCMMGCKSVNLLSGNTDATRLEASHQWTRRTVATSGNILLPAPLADVPSKGATGYCQREGPLTDPKTGQYLVDKQGRIQYGKVTAIGAIDNAREVAGINKVTFDMGDADTGIGFKMVIEGKGISSSAQAAIVEAWGKATAAEKAAAGKAAEATVNAWKGMVVEGISAGGPLVAGVLKAVIGVGEVTTASGAAVNLVDVLLTDQATGKDVPAKVSVPVTMKPASECVGDGCTAPAAE